ncbi:MAG: WecB/TagA/CpsF family glycosyltransferase [Candidatus Pacebacteria bacterium]|nr:WecB/TagA/CpsF family glycosyltransferase [Candidatus Paceibacterota bacterium]
MLKVFTPNPEQFVLSRESKEFSRILSQGDILIPDGIGVVAFSQLAGKLLKTNSIKERIAGVDLVQRLLKLASDNNWKVLLVGGKAYTGKLHNIFVSGLAKKTQLSLLWDPGYDDITKPTKLEEDHLVKLISKEQPELVFVAFGAPWQEQWVVEHEELLTSSKVKLAMVVGGSFDMLFGKLKRAPLWVRAVGLEWLFRLIQEPSRWRRQLKLVKFIGLATSDLVTKLLKK